MIFVLKSVLTEQNDGHSDIDRKQCFLYSIHSIDKAMDMS